MRYYALCRTLQAAVTALCQEAHWRSTLTLLQDITKKSMLKHQWIFSATDVNHLSWDSTQKSLGKAVHRKKKKKTKQRNSAFFSNAQSRNCQVLIAFCCILGYNHRIGLGSTQQKDVCPLKLLRSRLELLLPSHLKRRENT